ncbi:hypothetical protein CEXT_195591 [Caerostris extrusa]|uniref:ZP domain-containing protein n=1 Tax=Caerostris extrusa TaxID=172846 RepID=A0AAV4PY87_CAEEX|nr:hypothetical protein CEXT_195591 [Caerostris extrusa]
MNREHGVTVSNITYCCTRAELDGCCGATVTTPALPERSLPEDQKLPFGCRMTLVPNRTTRKDGEFHVDLVMCSYATIECKASKITVLPKYPRLAETTVTVPQDEPDLDARRHDMNVKMYNKTRKRIF